ncbi:MAG: ATP-binding cassette domain-containing protein [Succinatimonas hippei]|nr:ATP-binding cassette domain-containing protein [Succinatimonas hippei]
MITLEHVSKIFNQRGREVRAVDDVCLQIKDGEIFGIIGFSGAGKSTLVRCMNLLERPTSGKVFVGDCEITALDDKRLRDIRRGIGMIFQHFNLMPSRTVAGNIELPLCHANVPKQERLSRIRALLEMVGLSDKGASYPSQLSGGQKQRVAIARALACEPKVLLCDEATSALDPQTTSQILKLLKELNQKLGISIVVITHQMSVVKEICDRAAVMEHGRITESGSVYELFSAPKDPSTKEFLDMASNVGAFYETFNEKGSLADLHDGTHIWFLTYTGSATGEALMSKIYQLFEVEANILYGDIDYIKGRPLGKLAVNLRGKPENIEKAVSYIKEQGVKAELIK